MIDFMEERLSGYVPRTIKNAMMDATLAFAVNFDTAGERLTRKWVYNHGKQYLAIDINHLIVTQERIDKIVHRFNRYKVETINIAGNGIYTLKHLYSQGDIDEFIYALLLAINTDWRLENKISHIRTGGQTGADESGAKAGIKLGIQTSILAPKNWVFRDKDGVDIANEYQFKMRFE